MPLEKRGISNSKTPETQKTVHSHSVSPTLRPREMSRGVEVRPCTQIANAHEKLETLLREFVKRPERDDGIEIIEARYFIVTCVRCVVKQLDASPLKLDCG